MRLIDGLLSRLGMAHYGVVALLLFFGLFVAILIWTMTRSRREIDEQANLWKDDEDQ
jgi:cbb3-type cytochrome oxidase subunit 3